MNTPRQTISDKRLHELTILYQFSSTMLSTIRLNKLTHLILSILTSEAAQLFERAMLFLRNEKSGVLLGMLAVDRQSAAGLHLDVLASRWEISDELMQQQRDHSFCQMVRSIRLDGNRNCSIIRRVIHEQKVYSTEFNSCAECDVCEVVAALGVGSFAVVPLVSRNRTLGIIVVDNPDSIRQMSQEDLHFLQLIANQAGMAIENSMLYNKVEEAHLNLRDAKERLVHGERLAAIGEMAANLAHELKNPLITIGGFAARLFKALAADSRESRYADTIVREVSRLEKMLADILAFSRKPTICYNCCDMVELVRDSVNSCQTAFEDHNIRCTVTTSCDTLPVLGDAHQLKQALLNLLLNACDAMADGGDLQVIAEKSTLDNSCIIVSIQDTGGGIPVDMLPKVFNPFFSTKRHGTGLGLAIVNRIMINHGGRIEVANHGGGALFTIILPVAPHPNDTGL